MRADVARGSRLGLAVAIGFSATLAVDLATPHTLSAGTFPYFVLILLSAWLPWRNAPYAFAGIASVMSLAAYLATDIDEPGIVLANRVLIIATFWLVAFIASVRIASEHRLRTSENRLATILKYCPSAIYLKDLAGKYAIVNPQFERANDLPGEQIIGRTAQDIYAGDWADLFEGHDREVLDSEQAIEKIIRDQPRTDGPRSYLAIKFPVFDAEGRVNAIGGIETDITRLRETEKQLLKAKSSLEARVNERTKDLMAANRRLEEEIEKRERTTEALRESEQKFRELVEATVDRYWETDDQHRFVYFADPSDKDYSSLTEFLKGKSRWEVADIGTDDEAIWRQHKEDLAAHKTFRDFRYRTKDEAGAIRHWRVSGKPVFKSDGDFQGYIGTSTDVTDEILRREEAERTLIERDEHLRELQRELAQSTRLTAMGQLSSALAHELNQPLAAIVNYLNAARRQADSGEAPIPSSIADMMQKALTQARRASDIIKGMRHLVERGEPARSEEDANKDIEEVVDLELSGAAGRNVQVELQLASSRLSVPVGFALQGRDTASARTQRARVSHSIGCGKVTI